MLGLGLGTSKGGFVDALAEVTNTKSTLFDGVDEYVNFGNQPPIQDIWTSGGSVSCWIKPNSLSANNERVLDKKPVGFNGWYIALNNLSGTQCKLTFRSYWSGADYEKRTTNAVINLGLWNHIVITYNSDTFSNTATIYINGVSVALTSVQQPTSGNSVGTDNLGDLTAGCQLSSGSPINMFDGNIDEIAMWNDILTANEVTQIYNSNRGTLDLSTDTFDYSSSSNLKAWWRMGDEASTRVVDDNANNLVIPDMRKTFFTAKSIDFDGTNDYVKVGSQSFTDDSDFSISLWFKSSDTTKQTPLLTSPVDSTGNWSLKMKTSGKVTFSFSDGSNSINSQDDGLTCSDGQWHHVVMTVDRSNGCAHRRYIDGGTATVRGSTAVTGDLDTGNFYYIGAVNGSGNQDNFANAQICDVAIFDTVLDADTIASIYNSGEPNNLLLSASYTAGSGVDKTANLKAYYRMGNGSQDLTNPSGHKIIINEADKDLGSELRDVSYLTGTGSWQAQSNCTVDTIVGEDGVFITGGASANTVGALLSLVASGDFTNNAGNLNFLKLQATVKYNGTGTILFRHFSGSSTSNITTIDNTEYQTITYYMQSESHTSNQLKFHGFVNGTIVHIKDISLKYIGSTPKDHGRLINMSLFDLVDHAPNRNSGDMINFDATADIETDTPTQIYTVANTKSVLFDQTNDFIQFGDLDVVTDNFTISGWVKPTDASDFGVIMSKYDDNTTYKSDRVFRIVISGSVCICTIKTSSGNNLATSTTTTTLSDGEWFHFAFTNDGSNLKGYINGVLEDTDSTASGSLNSSNQNFLIGAQYVNTVVDNEFGGNIDEVGIWNEALTANEVAQIYHGSQANFDLSQNGGAYTSASNLQAWWRMGDGTIDDFPLIGDQTNTTLGSNILSSYPTTSDAWTIASNFTYNSSNNSYLYNDAGTGSIRTDIAGVSISEGVHKFQFTLQDASVANGSARVNLIIRKVSDNTTLSVVGSAPTLNTSPEGIQYTYYYYVPEPCDEVLFYGYTNNDDFNVKDIVVYKLNGNAGVMTNMASEDIETDTP